LLFSWKGVDIEELRYEGLLESKSSKSASS